MNMEVYCGHCDKYVHACITDETYICPDCGFLIVTCQPSIIEEINKMDINIYGQDTCERCHEVKDLLPDAKYHDVQDLYDDEEINNITDMLTASGGVLPIMHIRTDTHIIQLSVNKIERLNK